jgi:glycine cleavage system protein P-like pyridoxal-binding family
MRTSALWFGIVAIALAVSPAQADRKVDWSQYIDQRAVANANAPARTNDAPARESVASRAPAKASKKTAAKTTKTTKATRAKANARTAKKKPTRRK